MFRSDIEEQKGFLKEGWAKEANASGISTFCGRNTVRRQAFGIWHCGGCRKTISGGAYILA